jgi:hypothetical protein
MTTDADAQTLYVEEQLRHCYATFQGLGSGGPIDRCIAVLDRFARVDGELDWCLGTDVSGVGAGTTFYGFAVSTSHATRDGVAWEVAARGSLLDVLTALVYGVRCWMVAGDDDARLIDRMLLGVA